MTDGQDKLMGESNLDLSAAPDDELLTYMSWRNDCEDGARFAFDVFYARHVEYLLKVCRRAFRDDLDHAAVEDLVQDTFWRAYERAGTFNCAAADKAKSPARQARAWLGQIANRLFLTGRRLEARTIRLVTGDCERVESTSAHEAAPNRPLTHVESIVRRGLVEALDERERIVVEAFARCYDPGQLHQKPPPGLVAELCERLSTSAENVRQIRRRALRKLGEFIKAEMAIHTERVEKYVPSQGQPGQPVRRG